MIHLAQVERSYSRPPGVTRSNAGDLTFGIAVRIVRQGPWGSCHGRDAVTLGAQIGESKGQQAVGEFLVSKLTKSCK